MRFTHLIVFISSVILFGGCRNPEDDVSPNLILDSRLESWAPGTTMVEAVVYDSQEGNRMAPQAKSMLVEGGKKHRLIVDSESTKLSSTQLSELLDVIEGDYERLPGAGCYVPHHGFIFYDVEGKIIAHLEVCLLCGSGSGIPTDGIANTLSQRGPNEKLGPFLASIGLPVFEELSEWHEYFASKK